MACMALRVCSREPLVCALRACTDNQACHTNGTVLCAKGGDEDRAALAHEQLHTGHRQFNGIAHYGIVGRGEQTTESRMKLVL